MGKLRDYELIVVLLPKAASYKLQDRLTGRRLFIGSFQALREIK